MSDDEGMDMGGGDYDGGEVDPDEMKSVHRSLPVVWNACLMSSQFRRWNRA